MSARATQPEPKSLRDTHILESCTSFGEFGFNALLLEGQVRHREPEDVARGRAVTRRSLRGDLRVSFVIHGDTHTTKTTEGKLSSSPSKIKRDRK